MSQDASPDKALNAKAMDIAKGAIQVRVRFFGPARDLVGVDEREVSLPTPATVADALTVLAEELPSLRPHLPQYRVAVNATYTELDSPLREGDEVALIPPVSGGAQPLLLQETEFAQVQITREAIDLSRLLSFAATPAAGAIVTFLGTVRETSFGKAVVALSYEAYEAMAIKELHRIAEEIRQRWCVSKVAIAHRVGTLAVGEVAVAIVVSAPHRGDAFEAARFAIERLKEIVPIWKREHFADGTAHWVGPETSFQGAEQR